MSTERPTHTETAELPELDLADFDTFDGLDNLDGLDALDALDDSALAAALDEVRVEREVIAARDAQDHEHAASHATAEQRPSVAGVPAVVVLLGLAAAMLVLVCLAVGPRRATSDGLTQTPAGPTTATTPTVEPDAGVVSGAEELPNLPDLSNLPERPTPGATVGRR